MKKIILIIFLLPLFIYAQTITGSTFPVAGSIYTLDLADTTGVQPGNSGTGMTWNYATLVNTETIMVDSFMMPTATPYGGTFPTAQIAVHEVAPNTDYYVYFHNDGSEYQRIGNVQPDVVIYSNPANEFPYPVSYGNSFNDTYYASYTNIASGSLVHMSGATALTADGSGTLILPSGTYSNILRLKGIRDEHDTIFSIPTVYYHLIVTYYDYYQPSLYYPLLSITTTDAFPSFGSPFHTKTVGYRSMTTGIHEVISANSAITVSPNPSSSGIFYFRMNDKKEEIKQIEIIDLAGRVIWSASGNVSEVNLSGATGGVYFYHVYMVNGNICSGKIMKN